MNIKSFKPKFNRKPISAPEVATPSSVKSQFQSLKLIPLGGVGDVTKNMYIYEYGDDILIADCGVGFPDEAMLGIDLVIPDITYLKDKKSKIKGLVITHGHDDHIGGLPFLWPELDCPIYAPKFAAGLIRSKFSEFNLPKDVINEINPESTLTLGVFDLSFYQITHSIPDTQGIVIDTPVGRIIHQSDFKIDFTPVSGQAPEFGKIARYSDKGIILMTIDALRSEKKGYNATERTVEPVLDRVVTKATGKVLITTTSSNVSRLQQAINIAARQGRKMAFVGRSMDSNFQVARDLGYLDVPPGLVIHNDQIRKTPDDKLLIMIAGSQGQPESSLSRAANHDHKFVSLKKGDTVIFSADAIPSSEQSQSNLIDKLTKFGCDVHYSAVTEGVHVSGHAAQEELKLMISLVNPRYLVPIGATFKGMKAFKNLAMDLGYASDNVVLLDDGQTLEIRPEGVRFGEKIAVKNVYVDGLGVGDVGSVVLRDRQVLAEEGIVMVIIPVDLRDGSMAGDIDIITRGFVFEQEASGLLDDAKKIVMSDLKNRADAFTDWRFTRRHIEETLEKYLYEETKRRPMILPIVVEV